MTDVTSLPSKVVRAVRWYLVSVGLDPAQVFHHFDFRERQFVAGPTGVEKRIIDVLMRPQGPDVLFSGDDQFIVEVQIRAKVGQQLSETDAEQLRADMDADVGRVRAALTKQEVGEQNLAATFRLINAAAYTMPVVPANATAAQTLFAACNADMADFTLMSWINDVYGATQFDKTTATVTMRFRCTACETALEGYV